MKLNYLTYQTFPADTANSLQTITHLKYFSRNKVDVCLIFPLREKGSNGSLENLQSFYEFDEDIKEIKLGAMYVNQAQRWTNSLWTSISGGIFRWKSDSWNSFHRFRGCKDGQECYEFYRYGISAETDKFWENGQVNLKLKIDFTGHLDYHDGLWGYSDPDQFTWWSSMG